MAARTINLVKKEGYEDSFHDGIREASAVLDRGGLIVLPTETVYGVAARADRLEGIKRLYLAKQRPESEPFTLHIGRRSDAERYVPDLSTLARRFIKKGWPGPLTLLISATDPPTAGAGSAVDPATKRVIYRNHTIGLRCPDHPVASQLLQEVDGPVVAASANRAGRAPPVTLQAAVAELNGHLDLALDGGPTRYNRPSTIVRIDNDRYDIVREGVFDRRMIDDLARINLLFVCTGNTCRSPMARGIAERLVAERMGCAPGDLAQHNIEICSAGTSAARGVSASSHAVEVLAERSIDISSHTTQPLTAELVNRADYIFTMTEVHRNIVNDLAPSANDRTVTLCAEGDIADPIGAGRDVYADCAHTIQNALAIRLQEIDL